MGMPGGMVVKPTKTKSLGQIAREAYWWPQSEPSIEFVQKDWDRAARAVETAVVRRIRKKYPLIEYP